MFSLISVICLSAFSSASLNSFIFRSASTLFSPRPLSIVLFRSSISVFSFFTSSSILVIARSRLSLIRIPSEVTSAFLCSRLVFCDRATSTCDFFSERSLTSFSLSSKRFLSSFSALILPVLSSRSSDIDCTRLPKPSSSTSANFVLSKIIFSRSTSPFSNPGSSFCASNAPTIKEQISLVHSGSLFSRSTVFSRFALISASSLAVSGSFFPASITPLCLSISLVIAFSSKALLSNSFRLWPKSFSIAGIRSKISISRLQASIILSLAASNLSY